MECVKSDRYMYPAFVRDRIEGSCIIKALTEDSIVKMRDQDAMGSVALRLKAEAWQNSMFNLKSTYYWFDAVYCNYADKPVMPVCLGVDSPKNGRHWSSFEWSMHIADIDRAIRDKDIVRLNEIVSVADLCDNTGKLIASGSLLSISALKRQYPNHHAMVMMCGNGCWSWPETITVRMVEGIEALINEFSSVNL